MHPGVDPREGHRGPRPPAAASAGPARTSPTATAKASADAEWPEGNDVEVGIGTQRASGTSCPSRSGRARLPASFIGWFTTSEAAPIAATPVSGGPPAGGAAEQPRARRPRGTTAWSGSRSATAGSAARRAPASTAAPRPRRPPGRSARAGAAAPRSAPPPGARPRPALVEPPGQPLLGRLDRLDRLPARRTAARSSPPPPAGRGRCCHRARQGRGRRHVHGRGGHPARQHRPRPAAR